MSMQHVKESTERFSDYPILPEVQSQNNCVHKSASFYFSIPGLKIFFWNIFQNLN